MTNAIIYHNPRCSKSRQALQLLQENNITPTIVEYLKTPLNKNEIQHILTLLNLSPRDLLRKKENAFREQDLHNSSKKDDDIIQAMVENPILIERPIVVIDNQKAAIGRPLENISEIIHG